jgi:general secretion pathway protein J
MRQADASEAGFTLVELVVALFIFGLLAAAGASLLTFSVRAQAASGVRLDAASAERRLSAILAADLAQALPRVTRDAAGNAETAFAGPSNDVLLGYVRGGWTNSENAPRAGIQRVEWRLDGDRIVRATRAMADGGAAGPEAELASGVERVDVRLRDAQGNWGDAVEAGRIDAMPRAVELTIRRRGAPEIRRLFLVGAGQ